MSAVEAVAAVVRGDLIDWVGGGAGAPTETQFVDAAVEHSVEALVVWQLRRAGALDGWPSSIRTRLTQIAREETLLEAGRERELAGVIDALADAGVPSLLFKGAALAYSRYPRPWLRPRNDNDVLIRAADVARADRVMVALGYDSPNVLTGDFVGHQTPYLRTDSLGLRHVVEIHWKMNNRPLFADLLTYAELSADAIRIPALGGHAQAPGDVHALMIACLHPATHHHNSDNLVWCFDVHLLASRLGPDEFAAFTSLAREKEVAAICAGALHRAVDRFRAAVPPAVLKELAVEGEASAAYLGPGPWRGDVRLSDLRTLPGWRAKLQLIREVALPRSEYMLKEYDSHSRLLVPALHVHRLARGTWRLLRRFAQ